MNKKLAVVLNTIKETINITEESKTFEEKVEKLKNVLSIVYDELYDDFSNGFVTLPFIDSEGISIINPFYSECMRFEEDPFEYYNMTVEQIEEFCNFYGIN